MLGRRRCGFKLGGDQGSILGKGNRQCKGPEVRTCLTREEGKPVRPEQNEHEEEKLR